jgi:hypothetical protein
MTAAKETSSVNFAYFNFDDLAATSGVCQRVSSLVATELRTRMVQVLLQAGALFVEPTQPLSLRFEIAHWRGQVQQASDIKRGKLWFAAQSLEMPCVIKWMARVFTAPKPSQELAPVIVTHSMQFLDVDSILAAERVSRSWSGAVNQTAMVKIIRQRFQQLVESVSRRAKLNVATPIERQLQGRLKPELIFWKQCLSNYRGYMEKLALEEATRIGESCVIRWKPSRHPLVMQSVALVALNIRADGCLQVCVAHLSGEQAWKSLRVAAEETGRRYYFQQLACLHRMEVTQSFTPMDEADDPVSSEVVHILKKRRLNGFLGLG